MEEKEATLDELQSALAQSLAQMRELRQTLNDGIGPPTSDGLQTGGLPGSIPSSTGMHHSPLLGDTTSSTAAGFAVPGNSEAAPTTSHGLNSDPVASSSSTTLAKSNPFFEFISDCLDPLFCCSDPRKPRACEACAAKRGKMAPE